MTSQMLMGVRIPVPLVMRMQIVLILMGVTHAPALQDTLEMGKSALVWIALYNFNTLKFKYIMI